MMGQEKLNYNDRKVLNDFINSGIAGEEFDDVKKKLSLLVEQDNILNEAMDKVKKLQEEINNIYLSKIEKENKKEAE